MEERFWAKVARAGDDECWEWTAGKFRAGYGMFRVKSDTPVGAHRVAYELLVGPIPEGHHLDHMCGNRGCVNPNHLVPRTPREHMRRHFGKEKPPPRPPRTHCGNGHEYTPGNIYVWAKQPGTRYCRACRAARIVARRK